VGPLHVRKKRQGEELDELRRKRERLMSDEKKAKKEIKAHTSFNHEFFSGAHRAESFTLERLKVTRDISFSEFSGDHVEWQKTNAAKILCQKIKASEYRDDYYNNQRCKILPAEKPKGRLKALIMSLFTTSRMGLNISGGQGKRDSSIQSNFRTQLIDDYNSLSPTNCEALWCPILQKYIDHRSLSASHIFSYRHGQLMMDEIFGKTRPEELFSSRNGLLIHRGIEEFFDAGIFVIIPDIPELKTQQIREWLTGDIRNFKIRMIDSTFDRLNRPITGDSQLKWNDLNDRKLEFLSSHRPAARYLYFHYCLQILRRSWKAGPGEKAAAILSNEFGNAVWATPGRYIGRRMLRLFADTLGYEHDVPLKGALLREGNQYALMDALSSQIKDTPMTDSENTGLPAEDEDDTNDEDDINDEDYFSYR
jgi:hypothetical protein